MLDKLMRHAWKQMMKKTQEMQTADDWFSPEEERATKAMFAAFEHADLPCWNFALRPLLHHEQTALRPSLAGWNADAAAENPVPLWICDIAVDAGEMLRQGFLKRQRYAQLGIKWMWQVNLESACLSIDRLDGDHWMPVSVVCRPETTACQAQPFDGISIDLKSVWRR